jgi:hypothetical protein
MYRQDFQVLCEEESVDKDASMESPQMLSLLMA